MATFKYFSGELAVKDVHQMRNAAFEAAFPGMRGVRIDGFSKFVGHPLEGADSILPVTRVIEYKSNPSLHKCDARCRHAKGRSCECSCGGQFHGAGD